MKNVLLTALLILLNIVAFAQPAKTSHAVQAEIRELSGYHAIEASNGIEFSLENASSASTTGIYLEASSADLLKKIKTRVEKQVLKIFFDSDGDPEWRGVKESDYYKVRIAVADLRALRIMKGAAVTFEKSFTNTSKQPFAIDLLSGGKALGNLNLNALNITLRGGAKAFIRGAVSQLNVRAVEGSSFLSPKLESQECTAYAASSSHIRLAVDKTLDAQSINEAEIKYTGTPLLKNNYCKDGGKISKTIRI